MRPLRVYLGISIFWIALSVVGDGLSALVLPTLLIGSRDQATVLGLVTFVGIAAAAALQLPAGLVGDRLRPRWGRRAPLGVGVALVVASLALLASGDMMLALVGYVLVLMSASVAQAIQQTFIPDQIPVSRRGFASGLKGFMDVGGAFLAFIVVGQLLSGGDVRPAVVGIAVVVVVTFALTILLVREPRGVTTPPPDRAQNAFRLDLLTRDPAFRRVVASRFLFLLATYAVGRFFLFFVADRLGLDRGAAAEEAGGLLAALALLTALAAVPAGWMADRFGRVPVMIAGAAVSAAGVLLLATASGSVQILLYGALMAIGSGAFASANWAMATDLVPPDGAARAMAVANLGTAGAAALAGLFGPLVDGGNSSSPGAGYSLLFVAAALLFIASGAAARPLLGRATRPIDRATPAPAQ